MKKKKGNSRVSRLSLDKETLKKLSEGQLSEEEAQEIEGGTVFGSCCSKNGTYTSCG